MARKRSSSVGAVLFMSGAVLFAALAGVLLSRLLARSYPQEGVQPLVVAARDIRPGRPLRPEDLRQARWPQSSIPRGSFISPKRVLKLEAVSLASLVKGEAVLASHLSRPRSGLGVAAKLERGERAMAFRTDASVTLAQLIYPGARVDLLTTMRRPGARRTEVKTKVLLQNVRVLAVGSDIDTASVYRRRSAKRGKLASIGGASRAGRARRVVTVALLPGQAERVVLAGREGKIDVVLRSPEDGEVVETTGATSAEILGEGAAPAARPARSASPVKSKPKKPSARARRRRAPRKIPAPVKPASPTIYRGGK